MEALLFSLQILCMKLQDILVVRNSDYGFPYLLITCAFIHYPFIAVDQPPVMRTATIHFNKSRQHRLGIYAYCIINVQIVKL